MLLPDVVAIDELITKTFSFQNGIPFDVVGRLEAFATQGAGASGVRMSDFSNTAIVTVLDLPPGATFFAESGQIYPLQLQEPPPGTPPATAVPEPSSLALLGMGLLGVAGYARRRKPAGAHGL